MSKKQKKLKKKTIEELQQEFIKRCDKRKRKEHQKNINLNAFLPQIEKNMKDIPLNFRELGRMIRSA